MKAKNRNEYLDAWRSHARSLIHPAMDSEMPWDEWQALETKLNDMIEKAADEIFTKCPACLDNEGKHTNDDNCRYSVA